MTFQTSAPLTHQSLQASNRRADDVARMVLAGDLDLNAPYQRPSVWTRAQRLGLIRSWCLGVPVPAVMVNDRGTHAWRVANGSSPVDDGEPTYVVVDGKQRIETAYAWFHGDLAVPASWFETEDVEETVQTDDGPYVRYSGLSAVRQRLMSNRATLPVIETSVVSMAEEADLFVLINGSGTPQTEDDMANAAQYASEM